MKAVFVTGVSRGIGLEIAKVFSKDGYYVETGWATTNKNIDIPNSKTVWEVEGNNKLTPKIRNKKQQ